MSPNILRVQSFQRAIGLKSHTLNHTNPISLNPELLNIQSYMLNRALVDRHLVALVHARGHSGRHKMPPPGVGICSRTLFLLAASLPARVCLEAKLVTSALKLYSLNPCAIEYVIYVVV